MSVKIVDDYYCPMCPNRRYFGEMEIEAARHMRSIHNRKGGYTKRRVPESQLKSELEETIVIFDNNQKEAEDPPKPIVIEMGGSLDVVKL